MQTGSNLFRSMVSGILVAAGTVVGAQEMKTPAVPTTATQPKKIDPKEWKETRAHAIAIEQAAYEIAIEARKYYRSTNASVEVPPGKWPPVPNYRLPEKYLREEERNARKKIREQSKSKSKSREVLFVDTQEYQQYRNREINFYMRIMTPYIVPECLMTPTEIKRLGRHIVNLNDPLMIAYYYEWRGKNMGRTVAEIVEPALLKFKEMTGQDYTPPSLSAADEKSDEDTIGKSQKKTEKMASGRQKD